MMRFPVRFTRLHNRMRCTDSIKSGFERMNRRELEGERRTGRNFHLQDARRGEVEFVERVPVGRYRGRIGKRPGSTPDRRLGLEEGAKRLAALPIGSAFSERIKSKRRGRAERVCEKTSAATMPNHAWLSL